MKRTIFLDPVKILYNSQQSVVLDAVLIVDGYIKAFGNEARTLAEKENIESEPSNHKLIAPCLVDPHSTLKSPFNGKTETLKSLRRKAAEAGYGQVALLPEGSNWRDNPELLNGFEDPNSDISIHLWGSFTIKGKGNELSQHANLLGQGAIGLAECNSLPPVELLRKGFLTNELGKYPVLLAPRDENIQGDGIVREGVETLRAGWSPDPIESETLPLSQLVELQNQYRHISIRIMNLSTAAGMSILKDSSPRPITSVSWWHLIADNANLLTSEIGWRVIPSLGTPKDRKALINGLFQGTLTAVAVNSIALEDSEITGPPEQRLPGLTGYHLVLPCLWDELINKSDWTIEKLWRALSFGPSELLNSKQETLSLGSRRWLIFDPHKKWIPSNNKQRSNIPANEPFKGKELTGKIIECGLNS